VLETSPIDYCSLEQIKQWVHRVDIDLHGIDDDIDAEIKSARVSVKRQCDGLLKTTFDYTRRLEWADGEGQSTIMTRFYPLIELEYVRMYNIDYQRFFQYSGQEMIVQNRIGTITFPPLYITSNPYRAMGATLSGFSFFPGKRNIQVVYTTGFMDDTTPADFSEANAKWTAAQLLEVAHLRLTDGTSKRIIAGVSETYNTYFEVAQLWKEEAQKSLLRYRRISIQ
jgi:hypothetical protein